MSDSILTGTKLALGLAADDTSFNSDIIMHINSVFFTLNQLGIGPVGGYVVQDATAQWTDFLENDANLNVAKTYVYLRVRQLFDPPTTQYALAAADAMIKEIEWRLNVYREATGWVDPNPVSDLTPWNCDVVDGGTP